MRNTILCELSRLERFLWLLNQTEPVHFLVPAQVAGTITTDAWKKGLSSLQRRHPFLTASIEQGANNAPCFLGNPGIPIPLRVVEGNALQQLEAEVARELAAPFRAGDAWNNSIAETWLRHKHIDGGPNMFPLIGAEYVAALLERPAKNPDSARMHGPSRGHEAMATRPGTPGVLDASNACVESDHNSCAPFPLTQGWGDGVSSSVPDGFRMDCPKLNGIEIKTLA
jgi:hypothetical protein